MEKRLNEGQQEFLLRLARQAISHYLKTGKSLESETADPELKEKRGAFVTLHKDDQLRGCIGYPLPVKPLDETVIEMAIHAATKDYRFPALSLDELPETKIEISVLSLPRLIKDIHEIEIGKHGIIVQKGLQKGLLLPQVPVEWDWDLETFLNQGCLKAGLDKDEWKKEAQIEIFSAEVFGE